MKKFSFVFYYFIILVFGIVSIFALLKYTNIMKNFKTLSQKPQDELVPQVLEREVSIALSDRIGNLKYFMVKIQYEDDVDNLAIKAMETLFEMTKTSDERTRGCINPESDFISLELKVEKDAAKTDRKIAYITVSPEFREGRTDRQRRVAKKQIYTTLLDVYRELDDCKFIINDKVYEY